MALRGAAKDITGALGDLRLDSDRRLASAGLAALLVPAIWFVQSDFALDRGDWPRLKQRLLLRAGLVGIPVAGMLLLRTARTREQYSHTVFRLSIVIALFTTAINMLRPSGSGLPLRGPLLVLCVQYFALTDSAVRQCVGPMLLSLGTILLRATWLKGGGIDITGDVIAVLVLNGIGVLTVMRRVQLESVSSAAVSELRALRGIIPICSHCRNVRSEVGDWQQLERYVHDHSEALFSHGICPDCLEVHYKEHLPQ